MNREYLENYQQREREQLERLVENIKEDRFSLERDRFPSDDKFKGIQSQ